MNTGRRETDLIDTHEVINLGEGSIRGFNYLDFTATKRPKKTDEQIVKETEARNTIRNIDSDKGYVLLKLDELTNEVLEIGDIFVVNFGKKSNKDETLVTIKFLVTMVYSKRVSGYMQVNDSETNMESSVKSETLILPIMKSGKRNKLSTETSLLEEALFECLATYFREPNIKEILLYKKKGNKKGVPIIRGMIRDLVGALT